MTSQKFAIPEKKIEIIVATIVVTILLITLLDLPRPATLTGHPWKVELLTSFFLLVVSIFLVFRTRIKDFFPNKNRIIIYLTAPFVLFIVWSGLSYFWADSSRSVAHHTFSWLSYLIIFILAFCYISKTKNVRLLTYIFSGISLIIFLLIATDYLSAMQFAGSNGTLRVRYAKFAELTLTLSPVLWALAFYFKDLRLRSFLLLAGICGWLTTMLSLSKGAFLAGLISYVLLFLGISLFSKAKYQRKVLAFAGIWIAVTLGTQLYFKYATEVSSTVDYISGKKDDDRESSYMRVFTWKVGSQMIVDNLLKGVGADNFGLEFNNSRKIYSLKNPDDPLNATAESYAVERSHNEFIQILAELGIVGFLLFSAIFLTLLFYIVKLIFINRYKLSPLFWGSFAGMSGFFVSSLFSSFSFRAMQNGIVFFLVMALLCYELSKVSIDKSDFKFDIQKFQKPAFACLSILFLLAVTNFLTHSLSVFNVLFAEQTKDTEVAQTYYEKAKFFDSENGSIYLSEANTFYNAKRYDKAARSFRKAIDTGANVSVSYYYLASSQSLSGDKIAAEKTLAEASEIFSHSIYVRTHYAILLEQNGKTDESVKQFEFAAKLDPRQAESWKVILEEDVLTATLKAQKDKDFITPNDLTPANVVLAVFFDNNRTKSLALNQ